ncbi:MAG: hypothetical protein QHC79_10335 [Pseudosphingobacterium sp.]|nr:hypothetical protein [Pseudosphingobacterium sp.]
MDTVNNTYPALEFPASELSAFTVASGCFSISLKDGKIIHFTPENEDDFYRWLIFHNIRDIRMAETKEEKAPVSNIGISWKGLFKRKKNNDYDKG